MICKASVVDVVSSEVVSDECGGGVGFITVRIDKAVLAHPIAVLHALYMLVVLQWQCSSLLIYVHMLVDASGGFCML